MCRNDVVQHFPTALMLYVCVMQLPMSSHIRVAAQRGIIKSLFIKMAACILHKWNLIPDGNFWYFIFTMFKNASVSLRVGTRGEVLEVLLATYLSLSIARCNNT
jgi:hypothetical protein